QDLEDRGLARPGQTEDSDPFHRRSSRTTANRPRGSVPAGVRGAAVYGGGIPLSIRDGAPPQASVFGGERRAELLRHAQRRSVPIAGGLAVQHHGLAKSVDFDPAITAVVEMLIDGAAQFLAGVFVQVVRELIQYVLTVHFRVSRAGLRPPFASYDQTNRC